MSVEYAIRMSAQVAQGDLGIWIAYTEIHGGIAALVSLCLKKEEAPQAHLENHRNCGFCFPRSAFREASWLINLIINQTRSKINNKLCGDDGGY